MIRKDKSWDISPKLAMGIGVIYILFLDWFFLWKLGEIPDAFLIFTGFFAGLFFTARGKCQ